MKDRFSAHANQYAQFRPTYPSALYEFIYQYVQHFEVAWDCGTGNGQAARDLSKKFKEVFATDLSKKQIENAYQAKNIFYSISNERSSFLENSVNLVTVAQAAHWLNMEVFSEEVKRVSKPNGMVALWGYGLFSIHAEIDSLVHDFYTQVVGSFWDKERRHIDEQYQNLYFPFQEIQSPVFTISVLWTLPQLEGYLTTWSAVQKYIAMHTQNPVDKLISQIKIHWKDERKTVNFPLFLKLGSVIK